MTVFVGLGDLANATRDAAGPRKTPRLTVTPAHPSSAAAPPGCPGSDRSASASPSPLSCDASITPIVMDDDGNPLDVGRTTRTIPRRLRRALDARDCGCAFPGCGRPAAWTDGHHIHHWSNGGRNETFEPGTALQVPPHPHPQRRLAGPHRQRPPPSPRTPSRGDPQVHPADLDRPPTKTHPRPQPKSATARLLTPPTPGVYRQHRTRIGVASTLSRVLHDAMGRRPRDALGVRDGTERHRLRRHRVGRGEGGRRPRRDVRGSGRTRRLPLRLRHRGHQRRGGRHP